METLVLDCASPREETRPLTPSEQQYLQIAHRQSQQDRHAAALAWAQQQRDVATVLATLPAGEVQNAAARLLDALFPPSKEPL